MIDTTEIRRVAIKISDMLAAHDRIRSGDTDAAVFLVKSGLAVFPVHSHRGQLMLRDLPQHLVGVYPPDVPGHRFFEDVEAASGKSA